MFRSSDAPRYQRGFLAVLCLYVASISITVIIMGMYWWSNKEIRAEHEAVTGQSIDTGEEEVQDRSFKCQL